MTRPEGPPSSASGTGELRIETRFHSDELNRFAIPVEVRGADLSVVAHTVSGQTISGLQRGETYFVSAQLPGGHLLTNEVQIPLTGDLPGVAVLEPPVSTQPSDATDEVSHYMGIPGRTLLPEDQQQPAQWQGPAASVVDTLTESSGPVILESLGTAAPAVADDAVLALLGEYAQLGESAPELTSPGTQVSIPAVPDPAPPADGREVQVRLYRGNALTSGAVAQSVEELITSVRQDNSLRITVPASDRPSFLQALQVGHPSVNVALPISADFGCEVILSVVGADPAGGRPDNAVSLDVHMADVDANALLRYRALGLAVEAATSVASKDASADLRLLSADGVPPDPVAAAVKAYALLRLNRVSDLDHFTSELHRGFPWLPDGAAVRGEYLARQSRHEEAVAAFLDMVDRGLPLFNEGLSATIDRLGLYLNIRDGLLDAAQRERIRGVLALLQRYSSVTDMRKMLLRFTGLSPCAPGPEPVSVLPSADGDPTRLAVTFPLVQPGGGPAPDGPDNPVGAAGPPPSGPEDALNDLAYLSATEQRFIARTTTRSETQQKIAGVRRGELSVLEIDEPSRVALRSQRVLGQPLVRESLGGALDRLLESLGTVERDLLLERVIGGDNLLGIAFLELGSTVARSVGRVHIREQFSLRGFGTGFLISPRLLITNNHVLPAASVARFSRVEFRFENGLDGKPLSSHLFDLQPDLLFMTNRELDFSVVAVSEQSRADGGTPEPLARFGFNRISRDQGKILLGESINIVQHPDGRPKQVALQQNELVDRLDDFLHYQTDTAPGSSGSPLYNNQWEIVGLHHSGVPARNPAGQILTVDGVVWTPDMGETRIKWIANEGARISSIIAWLDAASTTVPPEQCRLLREVLSPPTEVVVPTSVPPPAPTPVAQASAAEITSPAVPASAPVSGAAANGEITITVPLHITVRLGDT